MNPDQPDQQPDPKLQSIYNPLSAMRPTEQVLCEIKRHPIGIIGAYMSALVVIGVVLAAVILLPGHISNVTSQDKAGLLFGALIIIILTVLYTYVARVIYTGNRWILTDDSLTQITQTGLFRKHSSQLSLANLEDITADQNGILQSLVGYGDLRAETAGERSKFVFPYCPNPNEFARKILKAREDFIMDNPEQAKRANDKLGVPRPVMPPDYSQAQPEQPPSQPVYGQPNPVAPPAPAAPYAAPAQPAAFEPAPAAQSAAPPDDYGEPPQQPQISPPTYPPSADTELSNNGEQPQPPAQPQ